MERILSQEEIATLFSAIDRGEGEISGTKRSSSKEVTVYDFRSPERISKEQLHSLRLLFDFFTKNLSPTLSMYLRTYVDISLASIEQVTYGKFLQSLPESTYIVSIAMTPLSGNAALEINLSLVFPMIEMLLGGAGTKPNLDREISDIEQSIMDEILRLILRDLKEAWAPVVELDPQVIQLEKKPQLLHLVGPEETVVAVSFEIKIGENQGAMNFALPSLMLKVIKNKFEQSWSYRHKVSLSVQSDMVREVIKKVPVKVAGIIPATRISVADLLGLECGDVIYFDHPTEDPIMVTVGDVPKFAGQIRRSRNKLVIILNGSVSA